jgi:hypothetical protein
MWNILSKAFVERATGPVHVFLRAYNPESVLMAQEIPQLRIVQELNPDVKLVWHPVYTTAEGELKEITKDLDLTSDAPYTSRDPCVSALYRYLLRIHDVGNVQADPAYRDMGALLAANGNT